MSATLELEPGDTVVVRTQVRQIRHAYDTGSAPSCTWRFVGLVEWTAPSTRPDGRKSVTVAVLHPGIEDPSRYDTWLCDLDEIAWVAGDASVPAAKTRDRPVRDERWLAPGSYGDHKDPGGAMRGLLAELARITGKVGKARRGQRALEQLESWFDSNGWQALCPDGHYLGRHPDNMLDIGVWPIDEKATVHDASLARTARSRTP